MIISLWFQNSKKKSVNFLFILHLLKVAQLQSNCLNSKPMYYISLSQCQDELYSNFKNRIVLVTTVKFYLDTSKLRGLHAKLLNNHTVL